MQNKYNLPPPLVGKLTQRNGTQNSGKHAEEHDQACSLRKLFLYDVVLAQSLGDMLPEGGDIWMSGCVELDAVHCLDGAHGGDLLQEILGFVDEDEEAPQQRDVPVAGSTRSEGWPELPPRSAIEIFFDCILCRLRAEERFAL